ncbi:MAG: hypothetical protein KDB14_24115 [Planctomycetales bacterium]|nr:hypothetical protein [Planctomycetales bacterium]
MKPRSRQQRTHRDRFRRLCVEQLESRRVLAAIHGTKFNDLDGDGQRDASIIGGNEPDVVFVIDISGSTNGNFVGTPVGDQNNDGASNRILDAEIAGFIALNQQLIDSGFGATGQVSIVTLDSFGTIRDMNPSIGGVQNFTSPAADHNGNGVPDVVDVLRSLNDNGQTNFADALAKASTALDSLDGTLGNGVGGDPANGNVIFISDGVPTTGGAYADEVAALAPFADTVRAFGAGTGATLSTLQVIDTNAEIFTSTDELLAVFSGTSPNLAFTEPGLDGWTIELVDSEGNVVDTQVTMSVDLDENGDIDPFSEMGLYWFDDVEPGDYTVREVNKLLWTQTYPEAPGTWSVSVGAEDVLEEIDFGNQFTGARIDLNNATSPTATGFIGLGIDNNYTAERGFGWDPAIVPAGAGTFDRAPTIGDDLLRDGHFGLDNTFLADVADGSYLINLTIGDGFWARNFLDVYAEGVLVHDNLSSAAGQFIHASLLTTVSDGQLNLRIDNSGGDPYFVVNAIEIYPASFAGLHTLVESAPGSAVFNGSNANANALVTVTTDSGTISTPDASPLYAGVQVVADGAGAFSFSVSLPPGSALPNVTSEEVTGLRNGSASGAPVPVAAVRRLDFNSPGSPTEAGFIGVLSTQTYTGSGFGYTVATNQQLNRGGVTSMTSNSLYVDGHWGNSAPKTFRVQVNPGTSYDIRSYVGDRAYFRDNIEMTVEGVGPVIGGALSANTFSTLTALGATDVNLDGAIDITFRDAGGVDPYYVINGLDIAESVVGLPASAPMLVNAAGADGASLTSDQLQPLVAEAVARWSATGLTDAQLARLQNVDVQIADLDGQGAYGLAGSTRVLIDDNAAGNGWYVDPTPSSNDGFVFANNQYVAVGDIGSQVDLLTVVMHELGHIVGLGDQDPLFSSNSLMTGRIDPGVRRLSLESNVDQVFTSLRDDTLQLELGRDSDVTGLLLEADTLATLAEDTVDRIDSDAAPILTEGRRREHDEVFATLDLNEVEEVEEL